MGKPEELPLFDQFEEGTLLDSVEEDTKKGGEGKEKEKESEEEAAEKAKAEKAKAKEAEEAEAAKAKAAKAKKDKETDEEEESKKAEAKKKKEDAGEKEKEKEKGKEGKEGKGGKETDKEEDKTPEPEGNFWTDVEKITGMPVDIDWEKEGIDPETPEGAALREDALRAQTIENYLEYLEQNFPKGFRALQHEAKGGNIEDLYKPGEPDFSKVTVDEANVAQQESILMSYYTEHKGFSESRARRMVEADKDSDEGLFKNAKEALAERAKAQEIRRKDAEKTQLAYEDTMKKKDSEMTESVSQVIESGKIGSFVIPKGEKDDFTEFVLGSVQRDGKGGYVMVAPINGKTITPILQQLYFAYKRGDLSKIISAGASSEQTRKLKRKAEEEAAREKQEEHAEEVGKRGKELPSMTDFEE